MKENKSKFTIIKLGTSGSKEILKNILDTQPKRRYLQHNHQNVHVCNIQRTPTN